jgi:hypothetical protein
MTITGKTPRKAPADGDNDSHQPGVNKEVVRRSTKTRTKKTTDTKQQGNKIAAPAAMLKKKGRLQRLATRENSVRATKVVRL